MSFRPTFLAVAIVGALTAHPVLAEDVPNPPPA